MTTGQGRIAQGGKIRNRHSSAWWHCLSLAFAFFSLLVLLIPASVAVADRVVTFADANLEGAVREAIAKPTGDLYQSDLDGLTNLSADSLGIVDITGIECCSSLQFLSLVNNRISDISPIASLTDLSQLSLGGNQIDDFSPIAGLRNLTYLDLSSNQIGDLSSFPSLTGLVRLDLGSNRIGDLKPLSRLVNLLGLFLAHNQISDISPIASLVDLENLDLSGNQIGDISSIASLVGLENLDLSGNQIGDIEPLVKIPSVDTLEYVNMRANPLDDTSINTWIPALQGRGVEVEWDAPAVSPGGMPAWARVLIWLAVVGVAGCVAFLIGTRLARRKSSRPGRRATKQTKDKHRQKHR